MVNSLVRGYCPRDFVHPPDQEALTDASRADAIEVLPTGTVLLGRFAVEYKLGQGGMGHVYSAHDRTRGTRVALKVLGQRSPEAIGQLKREFRTAAGVAHPNLVRLHELFCDGPERFFTMEFVGGRTVTQLLADRGAYSHEFVRQIFRGLAKGIAALHGAGFIHGDIKPSNFLVEEKSSRVVLLDFGLARAMGPPQPVEFAGTPAYMSPEQLLGHSLTEAADWYCFGGVLCEVLTGALPQRSKIATLFAGVPEDLAALCKDLLSLDPASRPSGAEVLRRLGASGADEDVVGSASRAGLVGRRAELATLVDALGVAAGGTPSVVLVNGPSGIGKTALVEHFLGQVRHRGATVLSSRCREQESLRYKAIDGFIDDLVALFSELDAEEARVLIPEGVAELAVVFPALLSVEAIARATRATSEVVDQGQVRNRAIGAFRELMRRLGSRAPVVLWVDDLQWSDAESALFVGPVLEAANAPVLFIGAHRDGEKGPLLQRILAEKNPLTVKPVDLPVGPLPPSDAEHLARDLLSSREPCSEDRAHAIGHEASGHPLFIAELALAVSDGSAQSEAPPSLSSLVERRVARLPAPAHALLSTAAVSGAPLTREVLRLAAGVSLAETESALDLLRARRLARTSGIDGQDRVDMHHDRIRTIVAGALADDERRRIHASLARALEGAAAPPEVLALHLEAAGELASAGRQWLAGAEEAFKALAFGHAADLFARAVRITNLTPAEQHAVELRRAEALALAGRGPEAADLFLHRAASSGDDEALELRRRAGEQLMTSGHLDSGLRLIEEVLGETRRRSGRWVLPSVIVGRLLLRVRGLRYDERAEATLPARDKTRIDALWTVASSLGIVDPLRAARYQNQHLSLALAAGEPRRLLRAVATEVPYAATSDPASGRRTKQLLAMASALAETHGDAYSHGLVTLCRGLDDYLRGRLEPAVRHFEETSAIFTEQYSSHVWEAITAQRFMIGALFFFGKLRRMAELLPDWLRGWEGKGNTYAMVCLRTGYSVPGWLVSDNVAAAEAQIERSRTEWRNIGFSAGHWNQLIGESFFDLYNGEAERSLARIREQWPRIVRARALHITVLSVQLWHLRAVSALAAARALDRRGQRARARDLRAEARRAVARFADVKIARAAPLSSLVRAALDHADGDPGSARRRLQACAQAFDQQQLRLFAASARFCFSELASGSDAENARALALAAFGDEGVASPRKMTGMLAPGFW